MTFDFMRKVTIINIIVSVVMFAYIFYCYAGVSGGDMAIIVANVFFGLIQLIVNRLYFFIKKDSFSNQVIKIIIVIQLIELMIFIYFGYPINETIKSFK